MNIEAEKIFLIRLLSVTQNTDVIKRVKGVLMETEPDWYHALNDTQRTSVKKGLREVTQGNLIDHETVMKKYRK